MRIPLVLVMGMCFFAGGIKFSEQGFGQSECSLRVTCPSITGVSIILHCIRIPPALLCTSLILRQKPLLRSLGLTGTTQLNCSLLIVSVIAILLPAAFHQVVGGNIPIDEESPAVLGFSRGVRTYFYSARRRSAYESYGHVTDQPS